LIQAKKQEEIEQIEEERMADCISEGRRHAKKGIKVIKGNSSGAEVFEGEAKGGKERRYSLREAFGGRGSRRPRGHSKYAREMVSQPPRE